jgi:hypothetical protein
MEAWMEEKSQCDSLWILKYVALEAQVHKRNYKEYEEKSDWSVKNVNI